MNSLRFFAGVSLVASLSLISHVFAQRTPWPPETDIPVDPSVVSGQLENGLRFAILRNTEPHDRASIRMLIGAGSLDETDEERGLAHYLEHMAFNGTKKFAADTLVEWFQRNGMSFGGDSNAATGFETTTYMLELPHGDTDTIHEGLEVLRDFADGMLLEESEVEKERGIIFAEKRSRDSVEFRTMMAEFEFVMPGTLPPRRFPIGVDETLEAANAEQLRNFLNRWYRPDNMVVVVVGDIDAAEVKMLVEKHFSSMTAEGSLPQRSDRGAIVPAAQPVAGIHREVEASSVSSSIQVVRPWEREPDSIATRMRDLPLNAANAIINRHLVELSKEDGAPFNYGSAGAAKIFDMAQITSIELTSPPDKWREALTVAEQEIRRALQHGFSPVELREITANMINGLEEAVRSASTRRSRALAGGLTTALNRDLVFTTPATDLEIARPAVEALTVDACLNALREAWSGSAPRIFVSGKLAEADTADDALAVVVESSSVPVEPPDFPEEQEFGYTYFGEPAEVVSRKYVEDLDIWLVGFSNGVRLNLKKTDFRANSVSLRARFGGGKLELPPDRPELAVLARAFLTAGGLGKHTEEELRRVLAGRTVGLNFNVGEGAFGFSGGTSPKDLELTLQLLAAYLTDAAWRDDAVGVIRRSIQQYYNRLAHLTSGVAQTKIPPLLASGDPRFGLPPMEDSMAVTPADVDAWLTPVFSNCDLEIAIIGDIDIDKTIELVGSTVGALPPRALRGEYSENNHVVFPAEPPRETFTVDTEIQKAQVGVYWPTEDSSDIHRVRRLRVLSSIMSDRLRKVVREELAAAYSPRASSSNSDAYPGYGIFSVGVEVDPPEAETILATILRIARKLQADGVTEDELERAREPVLTAIRQSVRENGYWLGAVLARAQTEPKYLDYARNREADIRSITVGELNELAALYLREETSAQFIVTPAEVPASLAAAAEDHPAEPAEN